MHDATEGRSKAGAVTTELDMHGLPNGGEFSAMVEHGDPTPGDLGRALVRLGRNHGPALLGDLEAEGLLTPPAAAAHVGAVWSMAEYPDRYLDHDTWRELFRLAGYTVDGVPAERPVEPLTLYRGSVPERRANWSWSDRLDVAQRYAAGGLGRRPPGVVWQATVEPWRLLARNAGPDSRDESEYVVDTEELQIEAAQSGRLHPRGDAASAHPDATHRAQGDLIGY